jgi:HlyD family secretion protein
MHSRKLITLTLLSIATSCITWFCYQYFTQQSIQQFFKTKQVQRRDIRHLVNAAGTLEVKQAFKIGSLIPGTIESLHVQENQYVKKGDLLARINNGKGDTDLQAARYNLIRATEEYEYQKKFLTRQTALYESGQLARDSYEFSSKEFKKAEAEMNALNEIFKKSSFDYENRNIIAPDDGIITTVCASKGMAVLNDFLNILFEMALDITDLEATLDIDECDIGNIKTGQKVILAVSTYPDQSFKGSVTNVSLTPKASYQFNGKPSADGPLYYKAKVSLKNKENLLRPGMGVNAKIHVEKSKNTLSITGLAFQINSKTITKLAKIYGYQIQILDEETKKNFYKIHKNERVRIVWTAQDSLITEKAIVVGITDDTYWEIKSGLTDQDHVIIDMQEPENMEKLYAHLFRKL